MGVSCGTRGRQVNTTESSALRFLDLSDPKGYSLGSSILIVLFLVGALVLLVLCRKFPAMKAMLGNLLIGGPAHEDASPSMGARNVWFLAGAALVGLALAWLEIARPYYFTQDDVLVGELPGVLWLCRSVWEGVLPEYNPYVLMGAPAFSGGGGTYPPTYMAYAMARHVLGNEYATVEVFAIFHILAGYAATYWASRLVGMGRMPAFAVSLSFVLSGSVLIMGRSWHTFIPAVLWMPLLVVAVMKMVNGPVSWKWFLGTGSVIGIAFHGEFPQIWVYSMGFFVLATVWLVAMGRIPVRRGVWLLPALLLGIGMAVPLLSVQFRLAADMVRPSGYGEGIGDGLLAMLLPYPLVEAYHPNFWGSTDVQYMGHFYYFGTLFAVLCAASVLALIATRPRRAVWAEHVWTVCACLAFVAALGPDGGLWLVMCDLPVFGTINNNPFRLLFFFVFFAVLSGGVLLERLLQRTTRRRAWELAIGATLGLTMLYHVGMCRPSFYSYGFQPYPEPTAEMASLLRPQGTQAPHRLASWAPMRSIVPSFALALPLNLPVIYGLPAFAGYSPLVECKSPFLFAKDRLRQDPAAAARAYGIRWFLRHRTCDAPVFSPNPAALGFEMHVEFNSDFKQIKFSRVHELPGLPDLVLMELDHVDPLAFAAGNLRQAMPLRFDGAGIDVDVRGLSSPSPVVVNFLWYPEMKAAVDGREVECSRDDWYRITVNVPTGAEVLEIRYSPDWRKGIIFGLVLAGLSLATAVCLDGLPKLFQLSRQFWHSRRCRK